MRRDSLRGSYLESFLSARESWGISRNNRGKTTRQGGLTTNLQAIETGRDQQVFPTLASGQASASSTKPLFVDCLIFTTALLMRPTTQRRLD